MNQPLSVVFYWHMHQPFYQDAETGRYQLPWVYLHAMKDYTDMAYILEQVPNVHSVVNYVPSLVEQIVDYGKHIQAWQDNPEHELPDPLLAALIAEHTSLSEAEKELILDSCFKLNHERNMNRYTEYMRLWSFSEHSKHAEAYFYLSDNYYTDLITWYHLAWLAESVRDSHPVAKRLFAKGCHFSLADRIDLLQLIGSLLNDLPDRYRRLVKAGIIELSTTPYAHPIMPLMLDFKSAQATVPEARIPAKAYPQGRQRVEEHLALAQASHEKHFGTPAAGCWPSEGAVSRETLELLDEAGFRWCATGEAVLCHSVAQNVRDGGNQSSLYHPWRMGDEDSISCFFRDDRLSDLIGFEYSKWHHSDAVANFIHELYQIKQQQKHPNGIVSIIMDGENAWEHYYQNGLPFLLELYQQIAACPDFSLTTFSRYLAQHPTQQKLHKMIPGSWVYGNLSTWIGDHAKTKAWELLIHAKEAIDLAKQRKTIPQGNEAAVMQQLRICEGSDWCWWFGDYNPSDSVRDFDRLYRRHVAKIYQLLDQDVPEELTEILSSGGGNAEDGGTMRRNV